MRRFAGFKQGGNLLHFANPSNRFPDPLNRRNPHVCRQGPVYIYDGQAGEKNPPVPGGHAVVLVAAVAQVDHGDEGVFLDGEEEEGRRVALLQHSRHEPRKATLPFVPLQSLNDAEFVNLNYSRISVSAAGLVFSSR